MASSTAPATVVICSSRSFHAGVSGPTIAGLTTVVDLDTVLDEGVPAAGASSALAIDARWLASRQVLRQALVRARHAAPRLEAAVLRGAGLVHHAVLAEEGIRVVLVDQFSAVGRGPRRPAPAGWPCRTVAWGLWEVMSCPPARGRGWGWLPGLPAPRAGALHVAVADDRRLSDWAIRAVARGQAVAMTLAELPAIVEGRTATPWAASVLKAA